VIIVNRDAINATSRVVLAVPVQHISSLNGEFALATVSAPNGGGLDVSRMRGTGAGAGGFSTGTAD